ncbi:MAG: hypothetical protein ACE5GJ_00650 [Gemmatimonadota bacterium]
MSARLRRLGLVLGGYALATALLIPVLNAVQGWLLLPRLFVTLGRGFLLAGAVVAGVLAWTYEPPEAGRDA